MWPTGDLISPLWSAPMKPRQLSGLLLCTIAELKPEPDPRWSGHDPSPIVALQTVPPLGAAATCSLLCCNTSGPPWSQCDQPSSPFPSWNKDQSQLWDSISLSKWNLSNPNLDALIPTDVNQIAKGNLLQHKSLMQGTNCMGLAHCLVFYFFFIFVAHLWRAF